MLQQCTSSSGSNIGSSTAGSNGCKDVSGSDGSNDRRHLLDSTDGIMDISSSTGTGQAAEDLKRVTHVLDCQLAEQLRVAAGEVGGRMSTDWANCEMRSIQLAWMPAGALQGGRGAAAAAAAAGASSGDGVDAAGGWLWATPGNGGEWWPGGRA
jgi:hypothetical protein